MSNMQKENRHSWAIVGFFTMFMAIMTYNLIIYPACALTAMDLFGIGQAELTTLSSVTSVVGVFAGIIFGRILDTRDVRKSITLYLAIGMVLFFVRAFISVYIMTLILTFLASFFVGICQVAAPKVVATWFPMEKIGTASSFFVAGSGIGSACGFVLGAVLGIQNALLSVGIAYLLLLIFWLAVGKEGPFRQTGPVQADQAAAGGDVTSVYKSRNLWYLIIAYSLAMTASLTLNSNMINSFIAKGLSPTAASMMGTVLNMCLLAGGFIMTAAIGIVKKFNPLLSISMLGGGSMILIAWFSPIGPVTWICVALGGLFFGGSLGLCVARIPLVPMTGDFSPAYIGTASGFVETVKGIISFLLPILIAYVLGTNFNGIFIVFGICCFVAFLCGGLLVAELGEKGDLFQKASKK